jgi:hypothetical protein
MRLVSFRRHYYRAGLTPAWYRRPTLRRPCEAKISFNTERTSGPHGKESDLRLWVGRWWRGRRGRPSTPRGHHRYGLVRWSCTRMAWCCIQNCAHNGERRPESGARGASRLHTTGREGLTEWSWVVSVRLWVLSGWLWVIRPNAPIIRGLM